MSIAMPYFNLLLYASSPFLRSVPYVKNTLTFIITKRRCLNSFQRVVMAPLVQPFGGISMGFPSQLVVIQS
jgi:hypothetical protein